MLYVWNASARSWIDTYHILVLEGHSHQAQEDNPQGPAQEEEQPQDFGQQQQQQAPPQQDFPPEDNPQVGQQQHGHEDEDAEEAGQQ